MKIAKKATIKLFVNSLLDKLGFELNRKSFSGDRTHSMPNWKERLEHIKKLGFSPKVIFDGGAFIGGWTRSVAAIFPNAQIVLAEPNPYLHNQIERNISKIQPKPILLNVALGELKGEGALKIWGDKYSDTGASLLEHVEGKAKKTIPIKVDTLDNISEKLNLNPDLIKLDLQGGEVLAIKGGSKVLRNAEFVILEFGCLEAYFGRATPRDIIDIMYNYDYCLYDIVDCHYRPYDRAMTGGDFFFVKNCSMLREYKGWE